MELIKEIIGTYGVEIIGAILTALATIAGTYATKLATKYINTKVKREIARTVVRGVEQLYNNLNGEEKLAKALEAAAEMLQQAGITVTDLELRMLLEDAVGEFNDVFNQDKILEGIDVDDLTDDQLRKVLLQMGAEVAEDCTREEMLTALDQLAAQA